MFRFAIFLFLLTSFSASADDSVFTEFQGDLFIAIPVPEEVQSEIAVLQEELKPLLGKTFVPSKLSNLHITLLVIGKTTDLETLDKVDAVLSRVDHSPVTLGSELSSGKIRVKTRNIKINLKSDALAVLTGKIKTLLHENGIPLSSRFENGEYTHITIGTVNSKKIHNKKFTEKEANKLFAHLKYFFQSEFVVDGFSLLKSNRPAPVEERIYAPIRTYEF